MSDKRLKVLEENVHALQTMVMSLMLNHLRYAKNPSQIVEQMRKDWIARNPNDPAYVTAVNAMIDFLLKQVRIVEERRKKSN